MAVSGLGCCSRSTGHFRSRSTAAGSKSVAFTKSRFNPCTSLGVCGAVARAWRMTRQPASPKWQSGEANGGSHTRYGTWEVRMQDPQVAQLRSDACTQPYGKGKLSATQEHDGGGLPQTRHQVCPSCDSLLQGQRREHGGARTQTHHWHRLNYCNAP